MKPANIILFKGGQYEIAGDQIMPPQSIPKITDFGISLIFQESVNLMNTKIISLSQIGGTVEFMSLEMLNYYNLIKKK